MNETHSTQLKDSVMLQVVSFQLASETYALDILLVQEIIKIVPVTQVPLTLSWIAGVINLRGQILPLIDLRQRVGLEKQAYSYKTRFIITRYQGYSLGLVVDSVSEVFRIPEESLISVTPTHIDKEYIRYVSKTKDGLVIILELEKIFQRNQLNYEQLQEQESVA